MIEGQVVMSFLMDPNVAYLLLVIGFFLAIIALFSPGTGVLEVGAIFMIVLAGYSIYNLPINIWALVILLAGVFPFLVALRKSRHWIYLILALVAFVVGSIFLFHSEKGATAINPILASVVSVIMVPLVWIIVKRGIEAISQKPSFDLEDLIGANGDARSDIEREGTVYILGEEWSARSSKQIPAGSRVRVVSREGLVLNVEPDPEIKS
jgi:membrane-bound serine protease (ClpP class)